MIALVIDRAELGLLPISIPDALATGIPGIVLMTWQPGHSQADNVIATSRWMDGGSLVSTRRDVITLEASFRVEGTSLANLTARIDELTAALDQFSYTVTMTPTAGTPVVFQCMPASFGRVWNADFMRANMDVVTASIPRQP